MSTQVLLNRGVEIGYRTYPSGVVTFTDDREARHVVDKGHGTSDPTAVAAAIAAGAAQYFHSPCGAPRPEATGTLPPYWGLVATRCGVPHQQNSPNKILMGRTLHFAREAVNQMQVVWPNFYVTSVLERVLTAATTLTGSIEYPEGVFTQLTFGGATSITQAPGGLIVSDVANITIPRGAKFFIRVWATSTGGIMFNPGTGHAISAYEAAGEAFEYTPASTADKTMGGTITSTTPGSGFCYPPIAILGWTTRRSFALCGDSRTSGFLDIPSDWTVGQGQLARGIGRAYAYTNLALSGETANGFLGNSANRRLILPWVSDVISAYGVNDIIVGDSAATTWGRLKAVYALFAGKRIYQATLSPVSSSTDAWVTVANQATHASNPQRVLLNGSIRAGDAALSGVLEVADVLESSRDSGKWKAPNGVALTTDGTHELAIANQLIEQSGVLSSAVFQ